MAIPTFYYKKLGFHISFISTTLESFIGYQTNEMNDEYSEAHYYELIVS